MSQSKHNTHVLCLPEIFGLVFDFYHDGTNFAMWTVCKNFYQLCKQQPISMWRHDFLNLINHKKMFKVAKAVMKKIETYSRKMYFDEMTTTVFSQEKILDRVSKVANIFTKYGRINEATFLQQIQEFKPIDINIYETIRCKFFVNVQGTFYIIKMGVPIVQNGKCFLEAIKNNTEIYLVSVTNNWSIIYNDDNGLFSINTGYAVLALFASVGLFNKCPRNGNHAFEFTMTQLEQMHHIEQVLKDAEFSDAIKPLGNVYKFYIN